MAVMYGLPFVIVVLNNGYLGLIRQAEKYMYDMNYEVQIWYDGINDGRGFDFVKFAEACGATGETSRKAGPDKGSAETGSRCQDPVYYRHYSGT